MGTVAHARKRTAPRERVATAAELAEEARHFETAREHRRFVKVPAPAPRPQPLLINDGDLVKTLAFFAAWRPCGSCRGLVLFVDENACTTGKVYCGACLERMEALGAESAGTVEPAPRVSVVALAAFALKSLFRPRTQVGRA